MAKLVALGLLCAFCAAATGCSTVEMFQVRPWEREALARRDMAWDPDPLEAQLQAHIHFAKEASLAGSGAGGGGCGCN
jgi:hypothetical protein